MPYRYSTSTAILRIRVMYGVKKKERDSSYRVQYAGNIIIRRSHMIKKSQSCFLKWGRASLLNVTSGQPRSTRRGPSFQDDGGRHAVGGSSFGMSSANHSALDGGGHRQLDASFQLLTRGRRVGVGVERNVERLSIYDASSTTLETVAACCDDDARRGRRWRRLYGAVRSQLAEKSRVLRVHGFFTDGGVDENEIKLGGRGREPLRRKKRVMPKKKKNKNKNVHLLLSFSATSTVNSTCTCRTGILPCHLCVSVLLHIYIFFIVSPFPSLFVVSTVLAQYGSPYGLDPPHRSWHCPVCDA